MSGGDRSAWTVRHVPNQVVWRPPKDRPRAMPLDRDQAFVAIPIAQGSRAEMTGRPHPGNLVHSFGCSSCSPGTPPLAFELTPHPPGCSTPNREAGTESRRRDVRCADSKEGRMSYGIVLVFEGVSEDQYWAVNGKLGIDRD